MEQQKVTPEIANAAIEQAESEARSTDSAEDTKQMDRIMPAGEIKVGGFTAHKLSWARSTIIVRALGIREEDADSPADVLVADNMDAITVATYVLFESSITTLHQLAKKGGAIVERALEFAEEVDEESYSSMLEYAAEKLADLNRVNQIGPQGGESDDTQSSTEKNSDR